MNDNYRRYRDWLNAIIPQHQFTLDETVGVLIKINEKWRSSSTNASCRAALWEMQGDSIEAVGIKAQATKIVPTLKSKVNHSGSISDFQAEKLIMAFPERYQPLYRAVRSGMRISMALHSHPVISRYGNLIERRWAARYLGKVSLKVLGKKISAETLRKKDGPSLVTFRKVV